MEYRNIPNINIEDAHIMFRNFSGREGQYNRAGNRNFCIRLDDQALVDALKRDGWNVRELQAREPGEQPAYYISVEVSFRNYPAKVYMHTSKNVIELDENTIEALDYADIRKVDVTIRPYQWGPLNGRTGVKAYLKIMHVTIEEDVWAKKYAEEEHPTEGGPDEDLPF